MRTCSRSVLGLLFQWAPAASVVVGVVIALCALFSWVAWPLDLVAMVAGPAWIAVGLLLAIALGAMRRWRYALVVVMTAMLVARVGWSERRLLPLPEVSAEPMVVRVLQTNLHSKWNPTPEEAMQAVARSGADVVVITEFQHAIWAKLRGRSELSEAFPHFTTREWVRDRVPGCIVLSRWPIERLESGDGLDHEQVFVGRVHTPAGPLVIGQINPQSPRNGERWRRGKEITRAGAEVLGVFADQGIPVALACDLNGTSFGSRCRMLRAAGLVASKPGLAIDGTWPATMPAPLRIGIDDVWLGGGARAVSWRTVELPGSDHLGVEVGIKISRVGEPVGGASSSD
jgi:endonuclease/exonuclease/phosphatase (EEP) superfamily protein YafD